jgi:glycine/D-amino acid oxidase-like deaminating enzyme
MGAPGGGRLLADLVTGAARDDANPFSFRRLAGLDSRDAHRRLL